MKVVILAGGFGTRIQEESVLRPKPMVEIGGKPMLWHIMNIYAAHGFTDFVIALGYKGEMIKEYFLNFYALNNDLTVDLGTGKTTVHHGKQPNWRIQLVDTGPQTMTGGRIKRLAPWLEGEPFMATYGDGVGDVPIRELLEFHRKHGKYATVTGVQPPTRFGGIHVEDGQAKHFVEKPSGGDGWVNGGFFVFQPEVLDYIDGDQVPLERAPLERLTRDGQLMVYQHRGFWQPMDTLRERNVLEELWSKGDAPWKVWE